VSSRPEENDVVAAFERFAAGIAVKSVHGFATGEVTEKPLISRQRDKRIVTDMGEI
jgi:hypothetical protein